MNGAGSPEPVTRYSQVVPVTRGTSGLSQGPEGTGVEVGVSVDVAEGVEVAMGVEVGGMGVEDWRGVAPGLQAERDSNKKMHR